MASAGRSTSVATSYAGVSRSPLVFYRASPASASHMTKVPVLVTGGAGYIGSHAVLALLGTRAGPWR